MKINKKVAAALAILSTTAFVSGVSLTWASYQKSATIDQNVGSTGWNKTAVFLNAKLNDGDWGTDDAMIFAYAWNSDENNVVPTWYENVGKNTSDYYYFHIPLRAFTHLIFVRLNPSYAANPRMNTSEDTGDDRPVWNQTNDLAISDKGNNNLYTLSTYGSSNTNAAGAWSLWNPSN